MRILIVSQYFWPESFRINDLAIGLKEMGHEVTVLTAKPNYPQGRFYRGYGLFTVHTEEYRGIKIIRVPIIPRFSGKSWQLVLNYVSFVFFASLIAPFRCRGKVDIIFSYLTSPITAALPAILLKKIKKAPLYLWVQDLWPESVSATGAIKSPGILNGISRLVGFIYRQANKILISSKSFHESIQAYLTNTPIPIEYFPNSVEAVYRPVEKNADFKAKHKLPNGFTLMFAGNVGYAQDFPMLLQAADMLRDKKDIHFVILGEGRHFEWVKSEVKAKNLTDTVHLLGRYPLELMPHFFTHADVLLASLRDEPVFELTVPCKIQSYLACGKPILAALSGEGGKLVEEAGAGLVTPPGQAKALVDAIQTLKQLGQEAIAKMSASALQHYNQFFLRDKLLNQLNEWFKLEKKA